MPTITSIVSFVLIPLATFAIYLAIAALPRILLSKDGSKPVKFGLSTLHSAKDAEVDIVLVHGLDHDSISAWSYVDPKTKHKFCWPSSELPDNLGVSSRVVAYDYDAKFRTPEYLTSRTLLHQTGSLIEALAEKRKTSPHRPIIFVCHSLGGLIVKNALVNARASDNPHLKEVHEATAGIVFLGTPHDSSPTDLAERLCQILDVESNDKVCHELRERSKSLAYSLERFKPLAINLSIHAMTDKRLLTRTSTLNNPDGESTCARHKHFRLFRDHEDMCIYSNPKDTDLQTIISSIDEICSQTKQQPIGIDDQAVKKVKAYDLGMGKILDKRCTSLSPKTDSPQLILLEKYFNQWHEPKTSTVNRKWPVTVLQGLPGCGKTETALRYVHNNRRKYASILWVNAANQRSLKLSFRDIARRLISQSQMLRSPDTDLPGLEGIPLSSDRNLEDDELGAVVQTVTEWLARPHNKRWLLVLDGLSPDSGYPSSIVWANQLDQRKSKRRSWRELLRLIPSTTGKRGHIIITTRDKIGDLGPEIIHFENDKRDHATIQINPEEPTFAFREISPELLAWWKTAPDWERTAFGLMLFLSDRQCSRIPMFLLESQLKEHGAHSLTIPDIEQDNSHIRLPDSLLARGPVLLSGLANISNKTSPAKTAKAIAQRAWDILDESVRRVQRQSDLISVWDLEEQVVGNIAATLRRCNSVLSSQELAEISPRNKARSWVELASICETHTAYTTAEALYQRERKFHQREKKNEVSWDADETATWGNTEFSLRLKCARVYQRDRNYVEAEDVYKDLFSDNQDRIPMNMRIDAYCQFARMRASQGRFSDAVDKVSQVLVLEDPFGDHASHKKITESISALATYLAKDGNRPAASAILQRMLLTLEETRGKMHPSTLGTMEALSNIKLKEGELHDAQALLRDVYAYQKTRLGEHHPMTVLCGVRIAAACDLSGDAKTAVAKYAACLQSATECFGPRHPTVFSIREGYVRCLGTLGDREKARDEGKKLKDEVDRSPALYSRTVKRRVERFVERGGEYDLDALGVTRSTLGVGGFEVDSDDSGFQSDDSIGGFY